jgi:hypothetical protein
MSTSAGGSAVDTRGARRLYRAAAVSNFIVTLPAFVAYDRAVALLADEKPRYPFLVQIWAGMALLWGVMFWEISRDPLGKYPMIKYSWLEKMVTSGAVTVAWRNDQVPTRFMVSIVFTDIVWIPLFLIMQIRLRAAGRRKADEDDDRDPVPGADEGNPRVWSE